MTPTELFFTSYARLDNDDGKLKSAIDLIAKRVSKKVGQSVAVFFDTTDLTNGVEWETTLGKALKDLKVIVCLCSPAYLKSAFCAKEFEVFRRRVDELPDPKPQVAIVPVIWEPAALPEVMNRFHQPKDPRFPNDYYQAGLWRLSVLKSQEDNFINAIETLATDITRAAMESTLTPWTEDVTFNGLPNVLNNPRPERYGISVTVLHGMNAQWQPVSFGPSVGSLIDDVSRTLGVGWEDIPAQLPQLLPRLADAEQRRLASIVIVERDDALKPPWDQVLQAIRQSGRKNVRVLVGHRNRDLIAMGDVASGAAFDAFALEDARSFKDSLTRAATALRLAMINEDEAAKVVAPDLRDAAIGAGIPVDSLSTLEGPGAAK